MELEGVDLADPALDQFFLSAPDKLALVVAAAGILPTDNVVEIGAGIGSVARALPQCATLTLIELDERLVGPLRRNVPQATIVQEDALEVLPGLPCDVLLSNLPHTVTPRLLRVLPRLTMRTAIVATDSDPDLSDLRDAFDCELLAVITGADFRPPQLTKSHLMRFSRK